jgi:Fe2+ or Zn2+ uptake regulation protein
MTTSTTHTSVETEHALVAALRTRGRRVTSQRLVIHRALLELDRHASAEQVLAAVQPRLPGLSLPTIYATLELFEELGVVRRINAPGTVLYDPRPAGHHHLVCRRCGAVHDLDAAIDVSPALRAGRRRGFTGEHAEVVVSGLCARCAA